MAASLFGTNNTPNVNVNGSLAAQSFTGTANQTVFTLTTFTYTPGTNSLLVFINGQKQLAVRDFIETSTTVFTLLQGVMAGDFVDVIGFPALTLTAGTYIPPVVNVVPTVRVVSGGSDSLTIADAGNIVLWTANGTQTVTTALTGVAPVTIVALSGVTVTWAAGTGVVLLNTPAATLNGYGSAVILPGATVNTFDVFGSGGPDVRNGGGFYSSAVSNGAWILTAEAPWSGYFTKSTSVCKSGTCTMTVNVGATGYTLGAAGSVTGGTNLTANSVTSAKTDVTQTTPFTAGQIITIVVSANSSCLEAYLQLTAVRTGP